MEEEKNREIEIRFSDLWAVFLHCWWIMMIVGAVITVGLYIFMNATHEDLYTSTVSVYVMKESESTNTGDVSISNVLIDDFVHTATLDSVLEQVIYNCGSTMSVKEFRRVIDIEKIDETRFVEISVTVKDPERAAEFANALANQTCLTLNRELLNGQEYSSVANPGKAPDLDKPSNPVSLVKILLIAFVFAIAIYAVYLVLFLMDDKINSPEDVAKYLELSILGQIPNKYDVNRSSKKYYAAYTSKQQ